MRAAVALILFIIVNIIVVFLDMVLGFVVVFLQGQTISSDSSSSSSNSTMTTGAQAMTYVRLILSLIFPSVNLKHGLYNIHLRSSSSCVTNVNSVLGTSYSASEPWMSMNLPGLGLPVVIFVAQMIFWWVFIWMIERFNGMCQSKSGCCQSNNQHEVTNDWDDSVGEY